MARMKETNLKAILRSQINSAAGSEDGQISQDRQTLMEYYLGEPFGNAIDGRSQVISTDVSDTIESVMPDLVQIFVAGSEVVRFEPTGIEDVEPARQATDYVNHVFMVDNPGFTIAHDWIKDALLQINGIVKVQWDDSEQTKQHFYSGLGELEYLQIAGDPSIEVLEHTVRNAAGNEINPETLLTHDLKVERTTKRNKIKIENVPPDEFLIERRAASIEEASFTCHKTTKTASELLEMGFSKSVVDKLPFSGEQEYNQERLARFNREDEFPLNQDFADRSTRQVWLYDCYIRVDWDGDGKAELRQVISAGPGYDILHNEPVDDVPFVDLTSIRMPHKFFGRALAELVADLQLLKSTIWRQLMDNVYNINNARALINDRVDLEDYLNNRIGQPIRVEGAGPVGDSYAPVPTHSIANEVYPLFEYTDTVRETRTGVTRYGQGLDADSLNKTATGINQILGRQQQRILMIARLFAETGFTTLFRKILKLVVENQDQPRQIRLRGEFVSVDPRIWNTEMDVSVAVGIGHGTREQRFAGLQMLLGVFERILAFQGGAEGPLVNIEKIHTLLSRLIEEMGFKNADMFLVDVREDQGQPQQPQQPRPDPDMVKAQADIEIKQMEAQATSQAEAQKVELERWKAGQAAALDRDKAVWQLQLEAWKAEQELGIEQGKFDIQAAIRGLEAGHKMQLAEQAANSGNGATGGR